MTECDPKAMKKAAAEKAVDEYVKDGMTITVAPDGKITVE